MVILWLLMVVGSLPFLLLTDLIHSCIGIELFCQWSQDFVMTCVGDIWALGIHSSFESNEESHAILRTKFQLSQFSQ